MATSALQSSCCQVGVNHDTELSTVVLSDLMYPINSTGTFEWPARTTRWTEYSMSSHWRLCTRRRHSNSTTGSSVSTPHIFAAEFHGETISIASISIEVPSENVATEALSAFVIEGVSRTRNSLINGDTKNYDWDSGYTCHQLGTSAAHPFLVCSLIPRLLSHSTSLFPSSWFLSIQAN